MDGPLRLVAPASAVPDGDGAASRPAASDGPLANRRRGGADRHVRAHGLAGPTTGRRPGLVERADVDVGRHRHRRCALCARLDLDHHRQRSTSGRAGGAQPGARSEGRGADLDGAVRVHRARRSRLSQCSAPKPIRATTRSISALPLGVALVALLLAMPLTYRPLNHLAGVVRQVGGYSVQLAQWMWVPVVMAMVGIASIVTLRFAGFDDAEAASTEFR